MSDKNKVIDPLPDSFETEEAAGEFWDTHSTMDYQQHLEATDDTIEISHALRASRGAAHKKSSTIQSC